MFKEKIDTSKLIVIPAFIIAMLFGIYDVTTTSNEFGMADLILDNLLVPIIILSIMLSTYWILLTEDFWRIYEKRDATIATRVKTILKFLLWIPGMALYLFVVTQALLSTYNKEAGDERPISITGQIIGKNFFKSHGRTRYYVKINAFSLRRNIEITVAKSEYQQLKPGDTYTTERKVGALGFIYENK